MTSSPHVVQSILEQFTRCFNPTCETDGVGSSGGAPSISPRSSQHGRTSPFERLQDALRDNKHKRGDSSASSKNLDDSKRSQGSDVVAKAKKAAIPSPEILEEKSYKRKLEIFRTRDAPDNQRQRAKMSNDLVDPPSDSSDEEIKNLTRRNRFACGMNMGPIKDSKPIANLTKFFNIGQDGSSNPFGLCFATPVRAASPEDIETLSDDILTTEEFLDRHKHSSTPSAPDLVKDSLRGSDSITDDGVETVETVNSTLYFESKYNNFAQTSPPMPLFPSQSISVTPSNTNEISKMITRRYEEDLSSKKRGPRRNTSPKKRSTKAHYPSSTSSVAEIPKLAEI